MRRTTSLGALGQALHGRFSFKGIVSRVLFDLKAVGKVYSARISRIACTSTCFLFLVDLHPMTHVGSRRMCLDPGVVPPLAGFRLYAILGVFHHVLYVPSIPWFI